MVVKQTMDGSLGLRNNEERDWSNLPSDILRIIMGKVFRSDRIRMDGVCKSWLRVSRHDLPTALVEKRPWLMTSQWERFGVFDERMILSNSMLIDTSLEKCTPIDRFLVSEEERGIFVGASMESCSYGWVLFREFEENKHPSRRFGFFLFSPFIDEVIVLPKLCLASAILPSSLVATFHLSSKAPDSLIFCLHKDKEIIRISTCRPGDETWRTIEFQASYSDYSRNRNDPLRATYADGSFYCLFTRGQLGAFNVTLQQWTLVIVNSWGPITGYITSAELTASPGSPPCLLRKPNIFFKCDFSEKRWVGYMYWYGGWVPYWGRGTGTAETLYQGIPKIPNTTTTTNMTFDLYACLNVRPAGRIRVASIEPPCQGSWMRRDMVQYSSAATRRDLVQYSSAATAPPPPPPPKGLGMQLDKSQKPDQFLAVEDVHQPTAGQSGAAARPITLTVEEKLNVTVERNGRIRNFNIHGTLWLQIPNPEDRFIQLQIETGGNPGILFMPRVTANHELFSNENILEMVDPKWPFPGANAPGHDPLRWTLQRTRDEDETMLPLTFRYETSRNKTSETVIIRYEASSMFELDNVRISIPLPPLGEAPNVTKSHGRLRYDPINSVLEWYIYVINNSYRRGSGWIEFVKPSAANSSVLFPTSVSFSATSTYSDVKVAKIIPLRGGPPPKFVQRTTLITENYQIIE